MVGSAPLAAVTRLSNETRPGPTRMYTIRRSSTTSSLTGLECAVAAAGDRVLADGGEHLIRRSEVRTRCQRRPPRMSRVATGGALDWATAVDSRHYREPLPLQLRHTLLPRQV